MAQAGSAKAVPATTDEGVALAFVDQGCTGETPATVARQHGVEREVVKLHRSCRRSCRRPCGRCCGCRRSGSRSPLR